MMLVDQITTVSDVQQVLFGAGGDGVIGTALDGDVDQVYHVECFWLPPTTGGVLLSLDPNEAAANHLGNVAQATGTTSTLTYATDTSLTIARTYGNSGKGALIEAMFYAKSGVPRLCTAGQTHSQNATDLAVAAICSGIWSDTVANITSLAVRSSVAAGIKAGSVFRLYKR